MKRLSCEGSVRKWVRGREECCFVDACVYCGDLTVLVNDNEVRRVG